MSHQNKNSEQSLDHRHSSRFNCQDQPPTGISLGQVIRTLRKSQGMTLQDLADVTQTHTGNLSRVERGLTKPGLDLLIRISSALGYSLATVFALMENDHSIEKQQAMLMTSYLTLPEHQRQVLIDFAQYLSEKHR